jgi:hypothetical protein
MILVLGEYLKRYVCIVAHSEYQNSIPKQSMHLSALVRAGNISSSVNNQDLSTILGARKMDNSGSYSTGAIQIAALLDLSLAKAVGMDDSQALSFVLNSTITCYVPRWNQLP